MFPWFAVSSIGIFFYSDSDIYVTYSPHNLLLVLSFSNQTKFPTPFLSSIARKSRLSDCDCYFFFNVMKSQLRKQLFVLLRTHSDRLLMDDHGCRALMTNILSGPWRCLLLNSLKLCLILYQTKEVVFGKRRFSKLSFDRIYVPVFRLMRQWCGSEGGWSRPEKEATAEKAFSVSKLVCLCCVATYG